MTTTATDFDPHSIAEDLRNAEARRTTVEPLTDSMALSLEAAYAVQHALVAAKLRANPGDRWKGLKAGLTSRAKQKMVGIDEPILGQLLFSNVLGGRRLRTVDLLQPRVEPEIALYFGRKVTEEDLESEVALLSAVEFGFPALEVLDSRYKNYRFRIEDVVADNASTARVALGERVFKIDSAAISAMGVSLMVDGLVRETASAAAVLGNPITAARWVARKWMSMGQSIPARSILLTGGMTTAVPVAAGQTVVARFQSWGDVVLHCE